MNRSHRVSTTDPITLRDIRDPWTRPFVVEGDVFHDLVIYFESEETRRTYLAIPVECPGADLSVNLDNPSDDTFDGN
jgi:hypothetical protein